jgi:polyhydroxyalkanoate synthesis regulator phasin
VKEIEMNTLLNKGFLAGIGLLSMTREKAQKIVDELSQRGELQANEAKGWADQLVQRGEEERQTVRKLVRQEVKKALSEMGMATKEDVQKVAAKRRPQSK